MNDKPPTRIEIINSMRHKEVSCYKHGPTVIIVMKKRIVWTCHGCRPSDIISRRVLPVE